MTSVVLWVEVHRLAVAGPDTGNPRFGVRAGTP
jgi:hypothetical protein